MANPIQTAIAALGQLAQGRCVGGESVDLGVADAARRALLLIEPEDPYYGITAAPPAIYGTSSTYVEGTITYASSIDSIANLKLKYAYNAGIAAGGAQGKLPVIVLMHAYLGDYDNFNQADMRRYADYGFVVMAPGMRGRNGASGTADSSGRELYDVLDGIDALEALLPTIADGDNCSVVGYSGGGGNVYGLACKAPDKFKVYAPFFGISDYGYDEYDGWFFTVASANNRTQLTSEIGNRYLDRFPYRARNAVGAIAKALAGGGYLYMLHDLLDGDVDSTNAIRVAESMETAGLTNFYLDLSTPSSVPRWLHFLPQQYAPLIQGEWRFVQRARGAEPWSVPARGTLRVLGWIKTDLFEIWLGPDEDPRTSATGGISMAADVEYDTLSATYKITPLTLDPQVPLSSSMWVQINQGQGYRSSQIEIIGPAEVEMNAPSDQVITALTQLDQCIWNLRADTGVTLVGSDVSAWADQSGLAKNATASANRPDLEAAFEGHAAVHFDNAASEMLELPQIITDFTRPYTLVFMFRPIAGDASAFSQCNPSAVPAGSNLVNFRTTTTVAIHQITDASSVASEISTACAAGAWHLVFLLFDPDVFDEVQVQVDLEVMYHAPWISQVPTGTTRAALGCLWDQPGKRNFSGGRFREVGAFSRYIPVNERAVIYQYMKTTWGGLP